MKIGFLVVLSLVLLNASADAVPARVNLQPLPMKYGDTSRGGDPYAKDPTVIRHGDRYLMYYSIRAYQDKKLAPKKPAPFQLGWHTGIAESRDLVHWTRVADMDLRDTQGRPFWSSVAPCVRKLDGKIHLFYQRPLQLGGTNAIWHATSEDGLVFTNVADEPVFVPNNAWACSRAIDAEVYRVGDDLVLMYVTRDKAGEVQQLGLAKAPYASKWGPGDFVDQTVDAPLLKPEFPWEGHCIEAPTVIARDGVWYLFYAGAYNHERQMIGLATSTDGFHYTRVGAEGLCFRAGLKGAWNEGESGHPGVFEDDDGQAYLFFQGKRSRKANYFLSVCKVEFLKPGQNPAALEALQAKAARYARRGKAEREEAKTRAMRAIADFELEPPKILSKFPDRYLKRNLTFAMNGGIAVTPKNRLWESWMGGEDGPRAYTLLCWSDDGGKTWTDTKFVVDSHYAAATDLTYNRNGVTQLDKFGIVSAQLANIISNVWCDPDGRLHLFVHQSFDAFDGRGGTWEFVCENPDADRPTWSKPRYLFPGGMHNNPIVLKDGTWLYPNDYEPFKNGYFPELNVYMGCGVYASKDHGKTFERRGFVVPDPLGRRDGGKGGMHFAEHMVVENPDGSLTMYVRTGNGLVVATSRDQGYSWTEPVLSQTVRTNVARFNVTRLKNGHLVFVKNGSQIDVAPEARREMCAFVSSDEGKTWQGPLHLARPRGHAYPDLVELVDGSLACTFDSARYSDAEIYFARFTEADVLAGRLVTPGSMTDVLVASHVAARRLDKGCYVERLENAERFFALNSRLDKAFAFLRRPDLKDLAVGRYPIDGDDCYAMVQSCELKPLDKVRYESHRAFIDIQMPLDGPETYLVGRLSDANLAAKGFDEKKDIGFYDVQDGRLVTLEPGAFGIFFAPRGVHAPCGTCGAPVARKKVVVKVRADK